ncbi:non-hydrolyzing UDP-N-acetylglucosamine 2-epimerase [Succinispira mobilis]|uniref:non-hydrolyzing UDP-N-acetylglucosamine 2-epimerase n=1 Tax=Succinispira mobilis TaxID=78120 RepID=UPI00038134D9|nr:UDP-N-acetylglucosamine 2-epimerase (non-hydrolyzing) [Succinispira mobilis]
MGKIKVMTVFGTRPEAIKMAPLVLELQKHPEQIEVVVAVTAQHRQMLDQVLELFGVVPDYDLDIMSQGQTLYDITTRALVGLGAVLEQTKPDMVLVHGDTTTTFAGALAAYYQQIAVGHVEAGLRTGDIYSPYPEEMNRKLTGSIAELHFAPTAEAKANLLRENVKLENIVVTGNTVIDALKQVTSKGRISSHLQATILDKYPNKKIILVTTHRRENLGEPMRNVYKAIKQIVQENPDVVAVFPVHFNPKVRSVAAEELAGEARIIMCDPLEYEDFAQLMAHSYLILTDSGGIQEEAPALGKPVLVLRDTTERPEAIQAGTVLLIGTEQQEVYQKTSLLLSDEGCYRVMSTACNPYGDGLACQRIVNCILNKYGLTTEKCQEYTCKM